MALKVVDRMDKQPGCCIHCGGVPTNLEGTPLPAIELEGIDVNWGDSVYLCSECTDIIADLIGRVDRTVFDALRREHDKLMTRHDKLKADHKKLRVKASRVVKGRKAEKELVADG